MLSLIIDPTIEYPDNDFSYSPDENFPEYGFTEISKIKNHVYRAVRDCLVQAGLDNGHLGTEAWNPLGHWIKPGQRVFVLCNFANERRPNESLTDYRSRCTHGSVIRAVIDYILIAVGENGRVEFGNAPTQFCHWDRVLADTGADKVLQFYKEKGLPVQAVDLRLLVTDATHWGAIRKVEHRDEAMGLHINLGGDSLLCELEHDHPQRFRVMNYNPTRTESFHSGGKHEFVVNRKILEADVVFSIPKFKTHEKVGISCALKGFVGTVGHKDSLPHHRYGSPRIGGDEYPEQRSSVARVATVLHEQIQKTNPEGTWGSIMRLAFRIFKRLIRPLTPIIEGAWWGNDTCWRMVLDLVRIATYCSPDGVMQESPQRKHLVMIDGLIGGEGDGPAFCTARKCGLMLFGDNLPIADVVNAGLMGFDPKKIPLIQRSLQLEKYPLVFPDQTMGTLFCNSSVTTIKDVIEKYQFQFKPQEGWKGKLALK